jgi:signal transduction histidine kinase
MKVTALAMGIVYIVTAFTQKNRLLNYLAIGNAMLIGFSIVSFYMLQFPKQGGILFNSLFYYELGIVFELMFFILGLAYKNRIELIEKIKEQEALKLEAEKQIFETKIAILNARQKERNRISTDMHDELGAGITAIRLYSELAKSKPDKNCMPEIEKISHSANELLNSMNTIIWAMSSSNDSLENMIAYIRSYSQEYFENTGVRCRIDIMEGLPNVEVSGAIRKNVFLVVKETLNNILKHAKATEVSITLKKVPDGLALYIQDNGVGIDLDKIRRFGNGLKNMKKRMEEMNIDFSIENQNGTLVTLHYAIKL